MPSPIKCMVIGNSDAGKTTLIRTYIDKKFFLCPTPTSYHEYKSKATATDGSKLRLKICDTSGLEMFDSTTRVNYDDTDVFVICFSVTNPGYFGYIRHRWLPYIREYYPKVPLILVGTKVDLREDADYKDLWSFTPLTANQGRRLAFEIGAVEYLECSAVTRFGVSVVFDIAATCGQHFRKFTKKMNNLYE